MLLGLLRSREMAAFARLVEVIEETSRMIAGERLDAVRLPTLDGVTSECAFRTERVRL